MSSTRADIYTIKASDVVEAEEKPREFQPVFDAPPQWMAKQSRGTSKDMVNNTKAGCGRRFSGDPKPHRG